MIVAGEPSGDGHSAKLVNALRDASPHTSFELFGCAGQRMRNAGVEAVVKADDLAIMGIPEIAKALPRFLSAFRSLKRSAIARKPDAVILVDFPEFNLKLAKSLKRRGFKIIYYISPQLWGWRKYRRRTILNDVDLLLSILPFEKDWYARYGIENVEFVGSPLVNEVKPATSREEFRSKYSIGDGTKLVALLPGSRHKEITRILPPMLEAAAIMRNENANVRFAVGLASSRRESEVHDAIKQSQAAGGLVSEDLLVVKDETYDLLNAADAAAVASGTATLETGIIGTPMAIVYKTSGFNYGLIRPLIDIEHFGLINLIAGKRLAAEMIQDDLTPKALARELSRLLDERVNAEMRNELKAAASKLGEAGASRRAAEAILKIVGKPK